MSDYWEYQALAKMALEDGLELDHSMLGEGWIYQPNSRILIVREYDCCLCTLCFMSQYKKKKRGWIISILIHIPYIHVILAYYKYYNYMQKLEMREG